MRRRVELQLKNVIACAVIQSSNCNDDIKMHQPITLLPVHLADSPLVADAGQLEHPQLNRRAVHNLERSPPNDHTTSVPLQSRPTKSTLMRLTPIKLRSDHL